MTRPGPPRAALLALIAVTGLAAAVRAERAEAPAAESPRASLTHFLELARDGRFGAAAAYLELPAGADGPRAARRLKAVLDRHVWFDLDRIAGDPQGDLADGLPADTEEVATVPGPAGAEPVRLVRRAADGGTRWQFSAPTVTRIDAWYGALPGRWLLDHLPGPLLRPGPYELLWWQWLALPALLLVAWALGRLLGWSTRAVLGRAAARTDTHLDDVALERLRGPIAFAWTLGAVRVLVPLLDLYPPAQTTLERGLRTGFFVVVFWAVLRVIDVIALVITSSPWGADHPASRALVPLGRRVSKVVVAAMGAIAVMSELGYPVASLIAGLGIGGLALALAGQKTVENMFGAFSIGLDQPFREGDFVRVEDFVGTVEAIGLRSTRIRTLDRTVVSLPNGRLAEMRLETFAPRDRIRLACTLGVVYGTTAAQMRQILTGLERVLREHPRLWPDDVTVRFTQFGASSLDLEIICWFQTTDFAEFRAIREQVLLSFMEVVEGAGSSFAFPTRTIHMVSQPAPSEAQRD